MEIKLIGYGSSVTSNIREFDEQQFHDIVKFVNNLDVDDFDIWGEIYKSKNNDYPSDYETEVWENKIKSYMKTNPTLRYKKDYNSYNWVYIDKTIIGNEAFRYYFGIDPTHLLEVVEKLTQKFCNKNIPIYFKYHTERKKDAADKIILYSDYDHREEVENAINEVYNENKELFNNSERALPWIYESKTPGVYFAPEDRKHDKSYGEKFAAALLDAKKTFHYLYQEDRVQNQEQLNALKTIVLSSLFRNGLLVSKNNNRLFTSEEGIKTFYDKDNNCITNVIDEKNGYYYEVKFDSSIEGKKAFLKYFYTAKKVPVQKGVTPRVLTREERIKEVYNALYPQNNRNINNK
jgi:hypothetical protein